MSWVSLCKGLPTGAPLAACTTMMPNHGGNQPRTDSPPYTIEVNNLDNGDITGK